MFEWETPGHGIAHWTLDASDTRIIVAFQQPRGIHHHGLDWRGVGVYGWGQRSPVQLLGGTVWAFGATDSAVAMASESLRYLPNCPALPSGLYLTSLRCDCGCWAAPECTVAFAMTDLNKLDLPLAVISRSVGCVCQPRAVTGTRTQMGWWPRRHSAASARCRGTTGTAGGDGAGPSSGRRH